MKKNVGMLGFVLGSIAGGTGGYLFHRKSEAQKEQTIKVQDARLNKFVGYFNILDKWMSLKETGKTTESYLLERGYNRIAIYGMGKLAEHFVKDLKDSAIEIICGIDRNICKMVGELETYEVGEDEFPAVDAIVVTAIFDFDNIKKTLQEYINCDIISLEEIVLKNED